MKRLIALAMVFALAQVASGQDIVRQIVQDGNIKSLDSLLYVDELSQATKDDFRIVRNTIYAKYGLVFQSADLRLHFTAFPWYRPKTSNVDKSLTYIDKANVQLVQRIESNYPEADGPGNGLIGVWYFTPVMPDADPDHIRFNQNGTFEYIFQVGMELYGSKGFAGLWSLKETTLTLTSLTESVFTYQSAKTGPFGNDYQGIEEGRKYILPQRTELNSDFRIENREIIKGELTRDVIFLFGANWYK